MFILLFIKGICSSQLDLFERAFVRRNKVIIMCAFSRNNCDAVLPNHPIIVNDKEVSKPFSDT